jgi:2-polyprenyl-3-methyl-5-hydroxy-6-metoxy-1,4-benzoquinol methylase
MFIGGPLGLASLRLSNSLLRWYYGGEPKLMDGSAYAGKSKMEVLLGPDIWDDIRDKTVLDFGCGTGSESIEMAQHGARRVIGLDIVEKALAQARENAERHSVDHLCEFTLKTDEKVDVVLSFDAFEHYGDPADVLDQMSSLLKPEGTLIVSFGTPWYHPIGGHTFSPFPWAHLLFTEKVLLRWRSDFRHDGATKFSEVEGGLNQMTIKRFEKIVQESPFHFTYYQAVPIRAFKRFHNKLTREFTTSTLRCRLKLS